MMGGQNVELSVARLNVCTVLHVKPEKFGGARGYKGGANAPLRPPLNATLSSICIQQESKESTGNIRGEFRGGLWGL